MFSFVKEIREKGWINFLKNQKLNILFYIIIIVMLAQQIPTWLEHYKLEDTPAKEISVLNLNGEKVQIPSFNHNTIVIFWATWCQPCHLEMSRFNKSIKDKKIDPQYVYAVSIGEPLEVVKKFQQEEDLQMQVFADPENQSTAEYNVHGTPTIVFLSADKKITRISTGISPLGMWRAESFLQ